MGYLNRIASRACAPLGSSSGVSIAPALASHSPLARRDQLLNFAEFAEPSGNPIEPMAPPAPIAAPSPVLNAVEPVARGPSLARLAKPESRPAEQPWRDPSPAELEPSAPSVSFARRSPISAKSVLLPEASAARELMATAETTSAPSPSGTPRPRISLPTLTSVAAPTAPRTSAASKEPPERTSPLDRAQGHATTERRVSDEHGRVPREDAAARVEQAIAAARAWVSSEQAPLADRTLPAAIVPASNGYRDPDLRETEPAGLHIGVLKVEVVPPPAPAPKRERRAAPRSRPATPPAFSRGTAIYGWRQR